MTARARALLLTILGVVALSPDSLLIRLIAADPWTLLFWRGLFMALGIAGWVWVQHRNAAAARLRRIGLPGVLAGFLLASSTIFFVNAVRLTTVANTLVIIAAAPLLAAVLSRQLLAEAVSAATWVAAGAVFGGLAVIFGAAPGHGTLPGDLCAAGSALCIAGYLVALRYEKTADMTPAAALGGLFAALLVLPVAAPLAVGPRDLVLLVLLGVLVLGVSFVLITLGTRHLPAPEVGLVMLLETALGPLLVWLVLGEVPSAATLAGAAVILGAVVGHSAWSLYRPPRAADCVALDA